MATGEVKDFLGGAIKALRAIGLSLAVMLIVVLGVYCTMRIGVWNTDYDAMRAKYAGPPSEFVTLEGAQLHFRNEGAGRPLVLLHGSGASLHEWDAVADLLKTKYRVIRLDWPPFGLSVDSTRVYSSPRAAHLVAALVDHLA